MRNNMKEDWDRRAKENALYYISTRHYKSDDEFDKSGETCVSMLLNGIYDKINPNMTVLDIGCGIGRLEKHLTRLFREIHGVDVSPQMIDMGKKRLKGYKNIHLHVNNGFNLSLFPDESFDFIFSYQVFQHIPRKITYNYIKEAYRVLRLGGIFRFQVPKKTMWSILRRTLGKARKLDFSPKIDPNDDDTWTLRFFSKEELYKVLEGFYSIKFETIKVIPKTPYKIWSYISWFWITCLK